MIEPYPRDWHRRLDFIPLLGLKIAIGERDFELYWCHLSVSVQASRVPARREPVPTEYGELRVHPTIRNRIEYRMGNPDPRVEANPIPQYEILDDITNHMGDAVRIIGKIPDVVIKSRGVVERIPRRLENLEVFQGSECVYYIQKAYGNFVHRVRRALNMQRIENPYFFAKGELLRHKIIRSNNDPILKKLRSTLKTEFIVTDTHGWGYLGDSNILSLEQALTENKWWTDIGEPTQFQIPANSGIQGQIYRLLRRGCFIVV